MNSRRGQLAVVFATFAVAAAWFTIVVAGSREKPFGGDYRMRALVSSAAGLGEGANVMVAGLSVGRIDGIRRSGERALLELRLDDDVAPIPQDSRIGVRLRTVVGENYVELFPGKSEQTLPDGGLLPASHAAEYVDLNEILDTLRGKTRAHARRTLRSAGEGLDGHGEDLNRVIEGALGTIEQSTPVTTILAHDHKQIARLTDDLGRVMAAVGERGNSLRTVATGLRTTFSAVARRDQELGQSVELLPSTLAQVRSTTRLLRSITRTSAPVLSTTADTVRDLGPAIRLLKPVARDGRALVAELGAAAPKLSRTLARVSPVAKPASRALPQVKAVLCELQPVAAYLKPYAREVTAVLQQMGYATNWYDANGHAARLFASVGENSIQFLDDKAARTVDSLLEAGLLGKIGAHGYNPFPKPGEAAETATPASPATMFDVKDTYPRIKADC